MNLVELLNNYAKSNDTEQRQQILQFLMSQQRDEAFIMAIIAALSSEQLIQEARIAAATQVRNYLRREKISLQNRNTTLNSMLQLLQIKDVVFQRVICEVIHSIMTDMSVDVTMNYFYQFYSTQEFAVLTDSAKILLLLQVAKIKEFAMQFQSQWDHILLAERELLFRMLDKTECLQLIRHAAKPIPPPQFVELFPELLNNMVNSFWNRSSQQQQEIAFFIRVIAQGLRRLNNCSQAMLDEYHSAMPVYQSLVNPLFQFCINCLVDGRNEFALTNLFMFMEFYVERNDVDTAILEQLLSLSIQYLKQYTESMMLHSERETHEPLKFEHQQMQEVLASVFETACKDEVNHVYAWIRLYSQVCIRLNKSFPQELQTRWVQLMELIDAKSNDLVEFYTLQIIIGACFDNMSLLRLPEANEFQQTYFNYISSMLNAQKQLLPGMVWSSLHLFIRVSQYRTLSLIDPLINILQVLPNFLSQARTVTELYGMLEACQSITAQLLCLIYEIQGSDLSVLVGPFTQLFEFAVSVPLGFQLYSNVMAMFKATAELLSLINNEAASHLFCNHLNNLHFSQENRQQLLDILNLFCMIFKNGGVLTVEVVEAIGTSIAICLQGMTEDQLEQRQATFLLVMNAIKNLFTNANMAQFPSFSNLATQLFQGVLKLIDAVGTEYSIEACPAMMALADYAAYNGDASIYGICVRCLSQPAIAELSSLQATLGFCVSCKIGPDFPPSVFPCVNIVYSEYSFVEWFTAASRIVLQAMVLDIQILPENCVQSFIEMMPVLASYSQQSDLTYMLLSDIETAMGKMPDGELLQTCFVASQILRGFFSDPPMDREQVQELVQPYLASVGDNAMRLNQVLFETNEPQRVFPICSADYHNGSCFQNNPVYLLSCQIQLQ